MPRFEFTKENKVATSSFDYPKLKLKSGERARILVGLEPPVGEYVHNLNKPVVINGEPLMIEAEKRDGTKYKTNKMDFVSRPLCLGDQSVLEDKGADPKNCPVCKLAKDHPDMAKAPELRFAVHVIRYRTKGTDFTLVKPFSVELLVWSFTPRIFNILADLTEEFGDLRKHDLILGPCENETFQKFEVKAGNKAEWLASPEYKQLTAETFKENQIPDLSIACGARKTKQMLEQDAQTIQEAWNLANGVAADPDDDVDLDAELGSLLSGVKDEAAASGAVDLAGLDDETFPDTVDGDDELGTDELDSLLSGSPSPAAAEPAAEEAAAEDEPAPAPPAPKTSAAKKPAAKKPEPAAEPPVEAAGDDEFADLLAGL